MSGSTTLGSWSRLRPGSDVQEAGKYPPFAFAPFASKIETLVQITGEGLKQAAQNLAGVMPIALTIATQIVAAVYKLVG